MQQLTIVQFYGYCFLCPHKEKQMKNQNTDKLKWINKINAA